MCPESVSGAKHQQVSPAKFDTRAKTEFLISLMRNYTEAPDSCSSQREKDRLKFL